MADRYHYFHAEAHALTGKLNLPFEQEIKKQAFVKLEGDSPKLLMEGENGKRLKDKKPQENYLSQNAKSFRLEAIISYSAAHSQASGHRSKKEDDAFVTLATSVVEDLNLLNVVTADRVVAQISTTHFLYKDAPRVTFLGTHFENLKIAGHPAVPLMNLSLVGDPPEDQNAWHVSKDSKLMNSVKDQYTKMTGWLQGASDKDKKGMRLDDPEGWKAKQYHGFSTFKDAELQQSVESAKKGAPWDGITCSLVEHVDIQNITMTGPDGKQKNIPAPATSFGHAIFIPDFGTIFLGELTVNHNSFRLTMIRAEMGCLAAGNVSLVNCNVNGGHKP